MAHVQPRTVACTDQIMALLYDIGPEQFLSTNQIMDRIGGREGTSYIYQIMRREERFGRVISMKMGPNKNDPVQWRMSQEYWMYLYEGRRLEEYTSPEDFDASQD